jgi:hypothetical protein
MSAVRFHWQNLNEEARGWVRHARFPIHGRSWLNVAKLCFRAEWHLASGRCGLGYEQEPNEYGHTISLALPPVSLWLALELPWKHPLRPKQHREWSLRVFDWAIWWRVGGDPHSWSSKTPKWRDGNWHFLDTLLGKTRFSKVVLSKHSVLIPMPEGAYPATVELDECTWKRPRWFATRRRGATVDIPKGIPHEGKGENSWDCGEDRLFGLSAAAETVEGAIAKTVQSALKSRRRYDGNVMAKYPAPSSSPSESGVRE